LSRSSFPGSLLRAGFESAPHKGESSVAAILGSGSNIIYGRKAREMFRLYKLPKTGSRRLTDEGTLKFGKSQRRGRARAHTNQRLKNSARGINNEIRRDHDDGDDQIPPRPKFEKYGEGILDAPRNANGSEQLIRPPRGFSVPEDELRERKCAGSAARGKDKFGVEGKKRGDAVSGRRSVAKIAGDGGCVLDLHGANFPRGGLQAIKSAGKRSGENFAPGGAGAENSVLRSELNASDLRKPRNVEHGAGQRPVAKRWEDVSAAGKDGRAGICKNVESILKRIRPKVQKQWLPE
jgi:hypothetical protein